ncbi:MAG: methionyl-tRNA formyltransferase [Ruminococcaceae bacterium]|nr:methionyl-tRNA formyltransferase [Oscillospiraceae bacterium]
MRVLFMGTPDFAAECLRALIDKGEDIVGAVTQPDKPVGRGMKLTPPPVKVLAQEHGIPVYQPDTLRDGAFSDTLDELAPDVIYVAAYGKILPKYVLDYPRYGCINAHASILPRYRGAAPIQRAIMDGDTETGVTAMYMAEGLDTGDMILCEKIDITDTDNFGTVHDKLCVAGGAALCRVSEILRSGEALPRTPQDDSLSTYAAKITAEDYTLDFTRDAAVISRQIRGLSPVPLCRCKMPDGKGIKIVSAVVADVNVPSDAVPGQVISVSDKGQGEIVVACESGAVAVTEVRPEGKGSMKAADFVRGRKINVGDVLR